MPSADLSTLDKRESGSDTPDLLFPSPPMECPEKVAGHDVGDDGEQHQENRDPENPTVMHSTPARSTFSVVLVTMVLIVHTKQRKHITATSVLGKEKGPSRTGGSEPAWRFHGRLAFPCHVNAVEGAYHFDV